MEAATMDTKKSHSNRLIYLYVIGMGFGSISFGYSAAIIATTLGQPSFSKYMGLDTNPHASQIIGAMNSLFYAGGFFGSIFNSWFVDRFGRKWSIALACIIMVISDALCAGSVAVAMFIVFRFTTGWSCLMLLVSVPLWITEVAPPKGRGLLANIHALMAVVGYLLANYVGVGFYYYKNSSGSQWRIPLAIGCAFPLITLCIIPFVPESPRWLLTRGRTDEAWTIIERLHRNKHEANSDYAHGEFLQMQKQIDLDRSLDSSWRIVVTRQSYRKRALIACALLTFLYSSGTLVISNYGPELFAGLGFDTAQSLQMQAGIICCSCSALAVSLFVVDRIPRNVTLGVGMFAVAVPLALEAAMQAEFIGTNNQSGLRAGVAFIYLYIFCYGVFLDGPGYYYAMEIFPTHLRAKGGTLCVACYCLINIMWLQVAPIAFDHIGWRFYMVFLSLAVVEGFIMLFTFPNTLNKPLEEIAAMFGDDDLVAIYQNDVAITGDHEAKDRRNSVQYREVRDESSSGQPSLMMGEVSH